eukprot:TRINITY_DN1946_c0_g1_i3.p2 TRINITY_DN1946_c0_g1~~TRINITY_DN1946_c0_g1_i3.p2  ORF type:complete len:306 (+),score=7.35 TRINITY_DN1946_c0_g1_i3:1-918(+)
MIVTQSLIVIFKVVKIQQNYIMQQSRKPVFEFPFVRTKFFSFVWFLISVVSQQLQPVYYYQSHGKGLVISPSGEAVKSISGQIAVTDISAIQCGHICYSQFENCKCCNGFDYNPDQNNGSCFLRKFDSTVDGLILYNETKQNNGGWQTYFGWGESTVGIGYTGALPQHIEVDITTPSWHIHPVSYRIGYSTLGPNQMPQEKGENVPSTAGFYELYNMSLLDCALECNKLSRLAVCDGFVFNPFQQGRCILKKNLGDPQQSVISNDGWQYYWREEVQGILNKCFCPCESPYSCVLCNEATLECSQL